MRNRRLDLSPGVQLEAIRRASSRSKRGEAVQERRVRELLYPPPGPSSAVEVLADRAARVV